MARLPTSADLMGGRPRPGVQSGVQAARPGPVPNVGDGGAAGMMELGRALAGVGSDLDKVFAAEQDRADKLRAEDSFNQLRDQQLDLSLGEKNGFALLKGGDAANGDLLKKWTQRFDDAQRKIEGTLENDKQREAFRQRAAVARAGFQGDIYRHVARETDVYALSVYKGTLDVETRNAMSNWDDAPAIATARTRIENAVAAEAERSGWSSEVQAAARMSALSGMHAAVITQALANDQPAAAQQYYKANKAELDPAVSKTLANSTSDGVQKQIADGFQARYIASRNDPRTLVALEAEVAKSSLDEDRKNILVGRILGRRDTLELRAVAAYDRRLRVIQRQIDGVNRITLAGFEPNAEQMLTVLNAARGTELEPEVRQMMATANATKDFRNASPLQQEATISALEREARKDPTKFDVTVVQRFKTIHESQRRAAADDPVTFAVRQGFVDETDPAVQPLQLADPSQIGDALNARLNIARNVAAKYGTLVKPLTGVEQEALVAVLRNASAAEKENYFGGLANAAGSDFEGYKAVMAQIAPDDPVTAHAGVMAGKGRMATHAGLELEPGQANSVAQLILQGQAVLHPKLKDDGSPDKGKLWPMPPDTDMDVFFKDYERDAFAGNAAARNGYYQTAKAIYAARSVEAGDSSGELDSDRWEEAMQLATGGIVRVNGRSVITPWGMAEDQFRDQLARRIEDLSDAGQLPPTVDVSRLKDMPLRAIGDGRYVFQAGDGVLVHQRSLGRRPDGSEKGMGFLGGLRRPDDGRISTEISVGVEFDGKEVEIPTLVPTLTQEQVQRLLAVPIPGGKIPEDIMDKATAHARVRMRAGKSPFASPQESPEQPPMEPIIIDFNRSPAFRTSGHGRTPDTPSTYHQWIQATGGVLRAGENEQQAIQRWLQGSSRTLDGIRGGTTPAAGTAPALPPPGMTGVRG